MKRINEIAVPHYDQNGEPDGYSSDQGLITVTTEDGAAYIEVGLSSRLELRGDALRDLICALSDARVERGS